MKYTITAIFSILFSMQALAGENLSLATELNQCTQITSSLQRLACFDRVAGTPATSVQNTNSPQTTPLQHSEMMELVLENEKNRPPEHVGFVITESAEHDDGTKVMITAPASNAPQGKVFLSISCILNISRLQLISEDPVNRKVVNISFFMDDRPITNQSSWQVLQSGEVIDAGRGLPGIELIRRLATPGQKLRIQSDYEPFDGLWFEANALPEFIQSERKACHW